MIKQICTDLVENVLYSACAEAIKYDTNGYNKSLYSQ